jgi:prolyl-tRNA editing enzyme YbaK/EbsC (Cys-tRNA(Pro) deacylase)
MATEHQIIGAIPPIGRHLWVGRVFVDDSLGQQADIYLEAGDNLSLISHDWDAVPRSDERRPTWSD